MIQRLTHAFARYMIADQSGSSTVEFVIIFPVFMVLFISSFEAAMMLTRQVMLDRAIDLSVRDLRLGTGTVITHGMIRTQICNSALILPDCNASLLVELTLIDTDTYAMPAANLPCVDKVNSITPVTTFTNGSVNDMMVVRACYVVEPFFPTSGLGLQLTHDTQGLYYMTATSAFVNEPV